MKQNFAGLERAVEEYDRSHPLPLDRKYALLNALYEEAKHLGHFSGREAPKLLEHNLAIARILNAKVRDASRRDR